MARKRDEDGGGLEELAEELKKALGGDKAVAEAIAGAAMDSTNVVFKERAMSTVVRILEKGQRKRAPETEMTDAEIDAAIRVECVRHLVTIPEPDYRAILKQVEAARKAQNSQTYYSREGEGSRDPAS